MEDESWWLLSDEVLDRLAHVDGEPIMLTPEEAGSIVKMFDWLTMQLKHHGFIGG